MIATNINFLDELIENIKSGTILTRYSHDNVVTSVDGRTCLNFDCSGFVGYYYQQIGMSDALNEIARFIARDRNVKPNEIKHISTHEFHKFAEYIAYRGSEYWSVVKNPERLRRGDLIIYKSAQRYPNHCMLFGNLITIENDRAVARIIDSDKIPHINDTRSASNTGIGMGEITLYRPETQWDRYQHNMFIRRGVITMLQLKQNSL